MCMCTTSTLMSMTIDTAMSPELAEKGNTNNQKLLKQLFSEFLLRSEKIQSFHIKNIFVKIE